MQYVVFLVLSPVTTLILLVTIILVARHQRSRLTAPILRALSVSLGFLVANTLELAWPTESGTMLFAKLGYVFSTTLPVFLFLFTLAFTGRESMLAGARWLLFFVVPAATTALAAAEPLHGLIWARIAYTPVRGMLAMSVTYGWFYWVFFAYALGLLLLSALIMVRETSRAPRVYRQQSLFVILGISIPLALYLVYTVKLFPSLTKNFSPIAYALAGLSLTASIRWNRFLDLVPIARSLLVQEMSDGMIVLDLDGRLVDANAAAESLLGVDETAIGGGIERFPDLAGVVASASTVGGRGEITLGTGDDRRYYDARVTRVTGQGGGALGSMVLLRDVTETHALLDEKNRLISELVQAAAEIASLQGIIPICMYCKKIRAEDSRWEQLEHYITTHSDALFSHGLCPMCERNHVDE